GMGELHLEIIIDRLKREFKLDINQGTPQVAYKEAITEVVSHREIFEKDSGGKRLFADIEVEVGPGDSNQTGLVFENEVNTDTFPKVYVKAVETGFKNAMNSGVLAGFPFESLTVKLVKASYSSSDSDGIAFEVAAQKSFRYCSEKAGCSLLEPIMKTEVVTPEEYMGEVIADLNKRRGQINDMQSKAGMKIIKALVPLAEQFGYVTQLRSLTSGRASSTMEVSHYAEVPRDLAKRELEKVFGRVDLLK
ncbi:MAG: elongation factor G, partial [Thiotrichaceae bacterium]|nr:elongation factor G [Thiotrichaceae bacterium]